MWVSELNHPTNMKIGNKNVVNNKKLKLKLSQPKYKRSVILKKY
jgi:hypothetical protein